MEENNKFLGDDCIYYSNFEEELFDVVSVVELLQTPQENNDLLHIAPSQKPTFTSSTMKNIFNMMKSKEESVKKEGEVQISLL